MKLAALFLLATMGFASAEESFVEKSQREFREKNDREASASRQFRLEAENDRLRSQQFNPAAVQSKLQSGKWTREQREYVLLLFSMLTDLEKRNSELEEEVQFQKACVAYATAEHKKRLAEIEQLKTVAKAP